MRGWHLPVLFTLVAACGGSSPESLCEQVFTRRIEGPIRSFKENGPKNKDAFMKYCVALPKDYLECEAMGAQGMMAAGEEKAKACVELLKQHQEGLNRVLEKGDAAAVPVRSSASSAAPASSAPAPAAGGGDAKKVLREDAGCKKFAACCADAKAGGFAAVAAACGDTMSYISEGFIDNFSPKAEEVPEICKNHLRALHVKNDATPEKKPLPPSCAR